MKVSPIKRILTPTDFSKNGNLAVKQAASIASKHKAELYILHAVEIPVSAFNVYSYDMVQEDISGITKTAQNKLNELVTQINKEFSIAVKAICSTGNTAQAIRAAVTNKKIDVVVMGTHGAHGFNEHFAGSNALKTVSLCSCPVITFQLNAKRIGFNNIVLPIDDCFESRQKVDFTIALAKKYNSKMHILGVTDQSLESEIEKFKVKLVSVEKAAKKAGVNFITKILRTNNFGLETLRYARKVKADLISVLTDHESKYDGKFLGLFAQKIVNHSKIPVLSIHPVELGVYDPVSLAGSNSN